MNARLCHIINVHGFDTSQFARGIGVSKVTVNRWIAGKHEPLPVHLRKIVELWPKTDLHWLITGESRHD